jgi:hypothetical protein
METYEGKYVPPTMEDIEEVQEAHCKNALGCVEDCGDCLYDPSNLGAFTGWHLKKGSPVSVAGELKARIGLLYDRLDIAEGIEEVRRIGKRIVTLEHALKGLDAAPPVYHTVVQVMDKGQDWLVWEIDPAGRIVRSSPGETGVWDGFRVLNDTIRPGDVLRVEMTEGEVQMHMLISIGIVRVERKEVTA